MIGYVILAMTSGAIFGYILKHLQDSKYLREDEKRIAKLEGKVQYLSKVNDRLLDENKRMVGMMNKKSREANDFIFSTLVGDTVKFGGDGI